MVADLFAVDLELVDTKSGGVDSGETRLVNFKSLSEVERSFGDVGRTWGIWSHHRCRPIR